MAAAAFDWDDGNRTKCVTHGLSIEDIESVFRAGPEFYADADHSASEQRLRAIGRTGEGRWAFVAFTIREIRGATLIRPISARFMHEKEVRHYERQRSQEAPRSQD